jgi:hypothetical protein
VRAVKKYFSSQFILLNLKEINARHFVAGGTTFGKHLVQDIDLEAPCICHRKSGKKRNPKKPAKKMLRYNKTDILIT